MTSIQNRSILSKGSLAVSLAAIICGCGSNFNSIYRNEALTNERNSGRGFFIDANQRVIFTSPGVHPSANMDSRVIVCAEPSPDVIKAISSQLATAAQASYQGAQGSAELQHQYAEAVTALGQRTAGIQLLRDAYYRLCEARMNGFITNGTYPVALNRLDDAMVALLAIEHLTSPNASGPVPSVTAPTLAALHALIQSGGGGTPGGSASTTDVRFGVNAATAAPVKSITSIYQFKNLDETCLALAGTTLQAKFQVLENPDPNLKWETKAYILSQIEDEKTVHLWRYCNQIFDEFFLANSHILTDAPLSADKGSLVLPPTALVPGTKSAP